MILVFSGTKDGREIVYKLRDKDYKLIVTTATDFGKSLYEEEIGLRVISKRLDYYEMINLIKENSIKLVIDATHPYAEKVSENIFKSCKYLGIELFRYQRKESSLDEFNNVIEWVNDYEAAANRLGEIEGNILLTTGSKTLDVFVNKVESERLYPRILPSSEILKKCEDLGMKPSNIISMQGPFTKEMNIELIKKYDIDILVTKESGKVGGTSQKVEAAKQMGIPVIIISRPEINQEFVFESIDELIDKVCEING